MNIASRLKKLRLKLSRQKIEAILISQPHNRHYLSGFTGSAGYLLITAAEQILATDFRYTGQAGQQSPGFAQCQINSSLAEWFPRLVGGLGLKALAFEAQDVTVDWHSRLLAVADKLNIRLTPSSGLVEELRMLKETGEMQLIERAVALSDAAMEAAAQIIRVGMTEAELAWKVEQHMRENGSGPLPFEVIVASGPNAALPHHLPAKKVIEEGEPVIIDIGASYLGYASDLTRTLCAGRPDEQFRKVHDLVLKAQLTAEADITRGMTGAEADGLARAVIETAGYGRYFGHGLGHGLGLEIHEAPRLGVNATDTLTNGMVFTVEPGIYVPEWGGVRIEDTVAMAAGKISVLSRAKKTEAGAA